MQHLQSLLGILALVAFAWVISESRRAVAWRSVAVGLLLTFLTALILLKVPGVARAFGVINDAVGAIAAASRAGTSFVFGYLGGGQLPYDLKVGGAVGLSTAANIFLGMVEAPLFIRPYLASLTRSELFMVMTGGMAGIAGTVLVIYATILGPLIPDAAAHFVIASVMGAPAAILVSLIMVPELDSKRTGGTAVPEVAKVASSTMDAIVRGTAAGLELLLNICAMLIVLVALVHLANAIIGMLPPIAGAPITLQRVLGIVMAPVCWLMGIPWDQAVTAGGLMGIKTILNEFIAYVELSKLPADALDPRSRLILLYAMCGFANFGSLGIMIAGLATMAPERRDDVLALGGKSIVSGTIATCLMGAIVGVLT